jgi:hypothetical protein
LSKKKQFIANLQIGRVIKRPNQRISTDQAQLQINLTNVKASPDCLMMTMDPKLASEEKSYDCPNEMLTVFLKIQYELISNSP